MNQNVPSQPQHQLHTAIAASYDLATRNHLADVTIAFLQDAPVDDWALYLAHAANHLARFHPHPIAFLVILSTQILQAADARLLPA